MIRLKTLLETKISDRSKKVIGFLEVVNVKGIGDIVAKFDTGNGSRSSSLTYDTAELSTDKKTVNWELGGNKFTSPVIGFSNAEVGDDTHKRPIIKLELQFDGKTYKDVHISLVDRKDKSTKMLVNREFMDRIGCAVSPNKTFIVTSYDGEYSAAKSKGSAHSGITFKK